MLTQPYRIVKYNLPFSFPLFRDRRWIVCIGFLMGWLVQVPAQQSDFQFWPQVQLGYSLSDKFKLSLAEEVRLRENATQVEVSTVLKTMSVLPFHRIDTSRESDPIATLKRGGRVSHLQQEVAADLAEG